MKKNALIISVINGIVVGIQIIGQIVVARIFGARIQLDAFVSAVTIPTILTSVIASTLSDAFLPILKRKQIDNEDEANKYFFRILFIVALIILICSFGIDVFSKALLNSIFGARGIRFIDMVDILMKYMIYTLPFTLVGTLSTAYLYTKKRFFLPSISYLLGSILNLLLIIALSPSIGIFSMVIGFVVAIILQFFIIFPYQIRRYFLSAIKTINLKNISQELCELFTSWIPLIFSVLLLRFDTILTRSFSARLPEGYIVYVNLTTKLFLGLMGVMTIGIQTVFFPHLIGLIHNKNFKKAKSRVNKAKLFGFLMTIFTIIGIIFVAPFFIRILFLGGKFSRKNIEILISLFPYFILPSIGWGISQLFFQPIIAIGKQYILTIINIFAVLFSWLSATYIYNYFGGMMAISVGLIVLTFVGIIGSEILWQKEIKKLLLTQK